MLLGNRAVRDSTAKERLSPDGVTERERHCSPGRLRPKGRT
jgi:hypothetical protein